MHALPIPPIKEEWLCIPPFNEGWAPIPPFKENWAMLLLESMDQDPNDDKGHPLPTVERDVLHPEVPDPDDPVWQELCAAIGHSRALYKSQFGTVDESDKIHIEKHNASLLGGVLERWPSFLGGPP